MSQQKQNPKIDWGYYATTPRIVRTHYKKLTHVEKWLYVCLKDLCGDTGTCYRTLRVLSEETDLSTGTLSTGIRHLQEAGLIHAEKKRRNNNPTAKEVWHITIVDIWQENAKVHPTVKCSPDEHSDKNVQGMNNNVQEMNREASKRSPDEQKRSNFDDRSNNTEAIPITEERTIEDESNSDDTTKTPVVSSDTAHTASLQDEEMFTDEKPQGEHHAAAVSGYPHRVGESATVDVDNHHGIEQSRRLATPDARSGLETQEKITEGEHHATRVPTLPAANTPAPGERTSPRHAQDNSDGASLPADGLPVVRVVGSVTPCPQASKDGRDVGRDRTAQVAEKGQTNDGNQSRASNRHPDSSGQPMRVSGNSGSCNLDTPYQETLAETPTTSTPAQSLSLPQAEQAALGQFPKGKGKKQAEPKPETPKSPPTAPSADMAWGTRKCLMWFDFWRGGILIGKWKLMQASTCAKGLAEQFDEQTVIQARTDMEADPYYAAKGGCDVCDVANNIHKYLKRRQGKQQPAIQPALKVVKRYSSYDDPNFRSDQDFYPVEGGSYATASR